MPIDYGSNDVITSGLITANSGIVAGSGSAASPSFEFVGDADTGMFAPAANTIGLATSGVERLRISNVGNVGIGTATPSEKLHVFGNINIDGSIRHTVNAVDGSNNIAPITWYNTMNDLNSVIAQIDVSTNTSPIEGMLVFHTHDGTTLQERVRITEVGNVGIGTSTPSEKLHVVGTSLFANEVKIGSLGNDPGILNVYTNDASDQSAQINLKNGNSTDRLSFSVNDDINESIIVSTSNTFYITNNAVDSTINIESDTINLNGSVSINSTSLSTSQLINIINGGNLYLWSNFR